MLLVQCLGWFPLVLRGALSRRALSRFPKILPLLDPNCASFLDSQALFTDLLNFFSQEVCCESHLPERLGSQVGAQRARGRLVTVLY